MLNMEIDNLLVSFNAQVSRNSGRGISFHFTSRHAETK